MGVTLRRGNAHRRANRADRSVPEAGTESRHAELTAQAFLRCLPGNLECVLGGTGIAEAPAADGDSSLAGGGFDELVRQHFVATAKVERHGAAAVGGIAGSVHNNASVESSQPIEEATSQSSRVFCDASDIEIG